MSRTVAVALAILTASGTALAQSTPTNPLHVAFGTRVRVSEDLNGAWHTGRFAAIAGDTIFVEPCADCNPEMYVLSKLERIETRGPHGVHRFRRALKGAGIGGLAGTAIVVTAVATCKQKPTDLFGCGFGLLFVPPAAAGGAVIGAVVGAVLPTSGWRACSRMESLWSCP